MNFIFEAFGNRAYTFESVCLNHLLNRLFLTYDVIFYVQTTFKNIQEKFKQSFEYFRKYLVKWSICSNEQNAWFSIKFSNAYM